MSDDYTGNVPPYWWKSACEKIHHPIACVSIDHSFLWVNVAFERLVGYSLSELRDLSWMDITHQQDVGGDMASVDSVRAGERDSYTMSKRYKHKFGHTVPITLTVWRFPDGIAEVVCFVVEATPKMASQIQLDELRTEIMSRIDQFKQQPSSNTTTTNYASGENNNSTVVRAAIAVLTAIGTALVYLAYYALTHGQALPQIPGANP